MDTFKIEDKNGFVEFKTNASNTPARTSSGRFPKGNKEGHRFQKGHSGKPKGAKNRTTLIAKQFAEDVLYLDPETGKQMTYHELCMYIKKKADSSPRILNLLLDHVLGKPEEAIQETVTFILSSRPQEVKPVEAQEVEVQVVDKFQLPAPPEKSEEDEGQDWF